MPSSPRIPKEKILDTALQMLIRDGYESINIKKVAKELGCSTQPISHHFGSMEVFRSELIKAAEDYVHRKLTDQKGDGEEEPEKVGRTYCDIAIDEPNLFRFVCMGGSGRKEKDGMSSWLNYEQNARLLDHMIHKYNLTREAAEKYVQTMVVYFHGIACLVASGQISEDREVIYSMLKDASEKYLTALHLNQTADGKKGENHA